MQPIVSDSPSIIALPPDGLIWKQITVSASSLSLFFHAYIYIYIYYYLEQAIPITLIIPTVKTFEIETSWPCEGTSGIIRCRD
jgi:hypothetical protein